MSPKKSREYLAPIGRGYQPVITLSGVSRGYVLVRWAAGPLKGKSARLQARTLREVGHGF